MSLEKFPSFLLNFSEAEMSRKEMHSYTFKSFRLDLAERQLLNHDKPVPLTPKAFDVLAFLVERGGHLVEKDDLMQTVWADSFVEEANISRIIHTLRHALGEDDNGNKFIETVAKKGYRFVAEVTADVQPLHRLYENGNGSVTAPDVWPNELIDVSEPPKTGHAAKSDSNHKASQRPIFASLTVLIAIFFITFLVFGGNAGKSASGGRNVSIAILPLRSLNTENQDSIYKLGIADSLIARLTPAKGLTIRPLSATWNYLDAEKDAGLIGKEQKVEFVLSSSYQIVEGKIRVTSQLINVASGAVEETFKSDRNLSGKLETEDAIAAEIGSLILKRFGTIAGSPAQARGTTNEEAYRMYLQGTVLADKRTRADAEKAVEYFEQAIKLDPNYAPAYAGLANAHTAIVTIGGGSNPLEQYIKTKAAIEKALAIDDNLAEAHSYFGEMKLTYEWNLAGAERENKRAIELNPNSSAAHRMYALPLGWMGRFDEAIAEIKTAIDLEPASVLNHQLYGHTLYFARRYDEAIAELKRTAEMDPKFRGTYENIVNSYRLKGNDDQAFEWFVRERTERGENAGQIQSWKTIYAQSGWRGVDGRQLEQDLEKEKNGNSNYVHTARLYTRLGMHEEAIAHLEKAFGGRAWIMISLNVQPDFDALRGDPRFADLVRRVNLK